jgi:2-polyprenyl-3-methyl-5-hydroxy-6-metoxy-1,4-benzoquinol methylase
VVLALQTGTYVRIDSSRPTAPATRRNTLLRLSPLVAFVQDERRPGERHLGVYHRLTGDGFEVPPPLHELLQILRKMPLERRELERLASADGRATLDELRARHFLVAATEPARLLEPFLGDRLVRPAMNPAVSCRAAGGAARVIRLKRADRCLLPRTPAMPELVEELLAPAAASLLSDATSDGALSLKEALGRLQGRGPGRPLDLAWEAITLLTQPERQLVRVVPAALAARTAAGVRHHYLNQSFVRPPKVLDEVGDAAAYYQGDIEDARWNFDWVESTVNHSFRYRTSAFEMQSYGERLCRALLGPAGIVSPPRDRPLEVLEVGGGVGTLARDFMPEARRALGDGAALRYTIVDCSPRLLAAQRDELREPVSAVRFVEGDARELPLGDDRFDLIIANEMIADLPVTGPAGRLVQTGSLAFLERVAARLQPSGVAVITEYGDLDAPPRVVEHLNHPEYSIHFAPLLAHARDLGLGAHLRPLAELLQARGDAVMACGQQEHVLCLNRLLDERRTKLPYAAFCRAELERRLGAELDALGVFGLPFATLVQGLHFGPELRQFHALVLTGPGWVAPAGGGALS